MVVHQHQKVWDLNTFLLSFSDKRSFKTKLFELLKCLLAASRRIRFQVAFYCQSLNTDESFPQSKSENLVVIKIQTRAAVTLRYFPSKG